ncbi:MAG TPA: pyridoxamine 5'-phosphate oxidase family protein [Candidatus Eisenbacteria bacterium]|nr:pyridoxamine 5'-phosphate oxidase family protein [Candidatus Eisenbacteria bacterium]
MVLDQAPVTELLTFLRSHYVGVLATVAPGNTAHATSIFYYPEDDLRCYFLTKNETHKFNNIKENHSVALVVSDPLTLQTVQVQGLAKEVDYTLEFASTMKKYTEMLSKSGNQWDSIPLNHINNVGYFTLVQITPTWIRWTDFKNWGQTIKFEQTFP